MAAQLEKVLKDTKDADIKSILSVVADSAKVEVWIVSQELLELLPLHVQNQIVNQLRKH